MCSAAAQEAMLAVKVSSLTTKGDFARCYGVGRRACHDLLRLYALPHAAESVGPPLIRVGCPVSRRLGGAARRNRVRRVLREACRRFAAEATGDWDLVIVPQPGAQGAEAGALRSALRELLAAVGLG
jgi:ribonuclease P protein component